MERRSPETNRQNPAGRFLCQQILTNFEDSGIRLARITVEAQKLPGEERKFAVARVKTIRSCGKM